ncbi:hypothetical protein [Nocardiopsis oceani]
MASTLSVPATDRPLRLSLRLDSLACAVCGLVLLPGAAPLSAVLGLPAALLVAAGLFLLAFAAFLWWTSATGTVRHGSVHTVVAVNVLWILGSFAVVALFAPSLWGVAFVLAQAVAVAGITVAEVLTLRGSTRRAA